MLGEVSTQLKPQLKPSPTTLRPACCSSHLLAATHPRRSHFPYYHRPRSTVYVADGNLYFNRSSCTVAEASEIFAECAWEEELCGLWGHHGKRWVRMSELDAFCARKGAPPPTKPVVVHNDSVAQSKAPASKPEPELEVVASGACKVEGAAAAHVRAQVDAMRAGDFALAFRLNSQPNQSRLGSAATFETIVKSNASFAALAALPTAQSVEEIRGGAGAAGEEAVEGAMVELHLFLELCATTNEPPLEFAFKLVSERGADAKGWAWRTDGVRIVC